MENDKRIIHAGKNGKIIETKNTIFSIIHCTMLFLPVYLMVESFLGKDEELVKYLFLGILVAIPNTAIVISMKKIKTLWQYLLVCLAAVLFVYLILGLIPAIVMVLPALVGLGYRFRDEDETPDTILDGPKLPMALLYALPFIYSAFYEKPFLQKFSIIAAIIYFILWFLSEGADRIFKYLFINTKIRNLPDKRIKKVGITALLVIAAFIAVLLLVPAFSSGYLKIDAATSTNKRTEAQDPEYSNSYVTGNDLDKTLGLEEDNSFTIPPIVNEIMESVAVAAALGAIGYLLFKLFEKFRHSYKEDGDVVEVITKENAVKDSVRISHDRKIGIFDFSPNARIRKKYKHTVMNKNKNIPVYMTPTEIEKYTGIKQNDMTEDLHILYEKARYSEKGADSSDLRKL